MVCASCGYLHRRHARRARARAAAASDAIGGPIVYGALPRSSTGTCRVRSSTLAGSGWQAPSGTASGCRDLTAAYQPVWSTQPRVRSTPLCQRAIPAARVGRVHRRLPAAPTRSIARSSSRSAQKPDRQARRRRRPRARSSPRSAAPRPGGRGCRPGTASAARCGSSRRRRAVRRGSAAPRSAAIATPEVVAPGRRSPRARRGRCAPSSRNRVRPAMTPRASRPPVRGEQAAERGHEHDVAAVRHGPGERLDLRRVA